MRGVKSAWLKETVIQKGVLKGTELSVRGDILLISFSFNRRPFPILLPSENLRLFNTSDLAPVWLLHNS